MKKIILLIPLIILTGCSNKEKIFESSAKTYYENYMKEVNNVDEVTITLENLQEANIEEEYNLSKLKKCDKNSKIIFTINKDTKEIINKRLELKCK